MRNFFAILKDSFREALDTKVFYVMVGLSGLLTLLAATLSFAPRSPEKIMQFMVVPLFGDPKDLRPEKFLHMGLDPNFRTYKVLGAVPEGDAPEGPDSPYVITLQVQCRTVAQATRLREAPGEMEDRIRQRFGTFPDIDPETGSVGEGFQIFKVTEVRPASATNTFVPKPPEPMSVYFEAVSQPTPLTRRYWPHEPSLFFGALPLTFLKEVPLNMQIYLLLDQLVNGLGAWVAILISVVITAFFIPNMLRKGTIDLLLVKPIHRTTLLLYKFVGGLLFIFLNTAIAVLGIWVAIGLRSGIWAPSFLYSVFVITFFFAILYSASTLFAVLTRSPIVAILLTCGVWFVLYIVGVLFLFSEALRQEAERNPAAGGTPTAAPAPDEPAPDNAVDGAEAGKAAPKGGARRQGPPPFRWDNWFFTSVRAMHAVLPRTKDLDSLMSQLLIRDLLTANQVKARKLDDTRISWGESLTVSGVFIGLMLGLSCLRFALKDF
jgi:ABC-type transport system involved in multi-copper enzyme maturation permease subunit